MNFQCIHTSLSQQLEIYVSKQWFSCNRPIFEKSIYTNTQEHRISILRKIRE